MWGDDARLRCLIGGFVVAAGELVGAGEVGVREVAALVEIRGASQVGDRGVDQELILLAGIAVDAGLHDT